MLPRDVFISLLCHTLCLGCGQSSGLQQSQWSFALGTTVGYNANSHIGSLGNQVQRRGVKQMCIKCEQEGDLQNMEKQINLKGLPQKQRQTLISQGVSYFFVHVNNSIANLIKEIASYLKTREIVNKRLEMSPALGAVTSGSVTADSLLLALGSGIFFPLQITPVNHGMLCDADSQTLRCSAAEECGLMKLQLVKAGTPFMPKWNCWEQAPLTDKFLFIRITLSLSLQLLWVPNCAGSDAASPTDMICTQANMNGHGGAGSARICP